MSMNRVVQQNQWVKKTELHKVRLSKAERRNVYIPDQVLPHLPKAPNALEIHTCGLPITNDELGLLISRCNNVKIG